MIRPSSDYNPQPMSCARKASFATAIVMAVLLAMSLIGAIVQAQYLALPFLAIALALCGMGIAGIQRKHTGLIMIFMVYLIMMIVFAVIFLILAVLVATVLHESLGPTFEHSSFATKAEFDSSFAMVMAVVIGSDVVGIIFFALTLYYSIKARKEILLEIAGLSDQNPYPLPQQSQYYGPSPQIDEWTPGNVTVQQSDRSDWTPHPSQLENESAAPAAPVDDTLEESW